jgi:hypothetical protein
MSQSHSYRLLRKNERDGEWDGTCAKCTNLPQKKEYCVRCKRYLGDPFKEDYYNKEVNDL